MRDLEAWIGREEVEEDIIDPWYVAAMAGILDRDASLPEPGTPLPPCWHWLFFRPHYRASTSGPDGHERLGEFLPPVPLPRRMWAGGRIDFVTPLTVGERVKRTATIKSVVPKQGRSGSLVFVTLAHRLQGDRGGLIEEEQDLVYREETARTAPEGSGEPAPQRAADWREHWDPDPVLLFRYSALTFNSHRIHYDRRYCAQDEGYPGLVVHGPLLATLLLQLAADNVAGRVRRFDYRSSLPVFDTMTFSACGRREEGRLRLWVERSDGRIAMDATAECGDD